ncbi:MAG: helicase associated domain-containing protein [Curtobacterium sp.]
MTSSPPRPLTAHDRAWLQNARAVERFVGRAGRFPPYSSSAEEGPRLGVWLNNQRLYSRAWSKRTLPEWRRHWLDEHLPGWDTISQRRAVWEDALDDVAEEVAARGSMSLPLQTRGRRSKIRIDNWLYRQRAELAAGALDDERVRALDDRLPGWRDGARRRDERGDRLVELERDLTTSLDVVWLMKAKALRSFVQRTGSLPRRYDTEAEHGVGHFLNNCWRAARGNEGRALPDERRAWLDHAIPGWDNRLRATDGTDASARGA